MKIKNIQTTQLIRISLVIAVFFGIASCNKALPDATPIIYPPVNSSTTTIGDLISSDTSYSFFETAAKKVGQLAQLSQENTEFTVFLPNNNAFRASGITSIDILNSLPIQSLGGIVGYAIIPGQQFLSSDLTGTFPNTQLPTSITIGALPGTPLPLKLSTFLSKGAAGFFDNNIPVVQPDIKLQNGVVHLVGGIVAPPSELLKDAIYSNPDLSFFKAAIAIADSGQVGLNRLDSLLGYGVTNMTVLVPNNAAFQTLIFGTAYGYLLQQGYPADVAAQTATLFSSSPDVFSNPLLYSVLTATTVRGILVYHFLATDAGAGFQPNIRVFSNNFSTAPAYYTTLLNSAVAVHPGIIGQATFTGPFVSSLQFTGLGTFPPGGSPYSGGAANAIPSPATHLVDNHAVNGVYYIIDKVLLPQ